MTAEVRMILEKINKPNDIKALDPIEYNQLADEIRQFLIENISKTGGHLASNLGVVELTMALHLVFNLPQDKLIWDVGHQDRKINEIGYCKHCPEKADKSFIQCKYQIFYQPVENPKDKQRKKSPTQCTLKA